MYKVSVIILTYNQENTILRTINSICNQITSYPFEVIIGDDASTDHTRIICQEYIETHKQYHIGLTKKQQNLGVVRNYCECLRQAKGEYIMVCAGDDWWHNPNKIQIQVEYMDTHNDCIVHYSGFNVYYPQNNKTIVTNPAIINCDIIKYLIRINPICAPSACIRKCAIDKANYINDVLKNNFTMEDYPMWLSLSQNGKFCYTNASLITYTKQIGSLNNSINFDKKIQNLNEVKRIQIYYTKKFNQYDKYKSIIEESFYYNSATYAVQYKERHKALYYYKKMTNKTFKIYIKIFVCYINFLFKLYSARWSKGLF